MTELEARRRARAFVQAEVGRFTLAWVNAEVATGRPRADVEAEIVTSGSEAQRIIQAATRVAAEILIENDDLTRRLCRQVAVLAGSTFCLRIDRALIDTDSDELLAPTELLLDRSAVTVCEAVEGALQDAALQDVALDDDLTGNLMAAAVAALRLSVTIIAEAMDERVGLERLN